MIIWLAEDDHLQVETLLEELLEAFPEAQIDVLPTEMRVRTQIESATAPPDVAIVDVMMRWTDPTPNPEDMDPPADVENDEGFYAGIRCAGSLTKKFPGTPVLLYTILDKEDIEPITKDLPDNVCHVRKEPDTRSLIAAIRKSIINA